MFKKYLILALLVNIWISGSTQEIKFGVITDVHQGYTTDVLKRLPIFINTATEDDVDFIIQLGDFTLFMNEEGKSFMDIWKSFDGPRYHVLGNHDHDANTKQAAMDFLGMESNYYAFDMHGIHFIIMDDNHIRVKNDDGSYRYEWFKPGNHDDADGNWFGDEQLAWATEELANTDQTTVIFRHAGVIGSQQTELENIVSEANASAGYKKVLLGLNGHGHDDTEKIVDNVPYVGVPSASYIWNHQPEPYKTVQFAIVTINTTNGTLEFDGRSEEVEYQEGMPTHDPVIRDKSYTFFPVGIKSSFTTSKTDCSGTISFLNTSSESATAYFWKFGDGEKSTEESPIHNYSDTGSYTVQLAITKGTEADFSTKEITVNITEKPLGSNGTRIGSGIVDLSASVTDGGTIYWYDVVSGGTILATGPNFTTPALEETTSYYAENINSTDCASERVEVTATISGLGVETINSSERIKIYPNPTNSIININIDRSIEDLGLNIYNSNGLLVKTEHYFNANDLKLDLTELPQGIYVIKLIEKGNIIAESSIVKK